MITPGSSAPEYDALHESLVHAGIVLALPELHGGICGALCAGGADAALRWLDDAFADDRSGDGDDSGSLAPIRGALNELVDSTLVMLEDGALTFEPLLPSEDAPLDTQVQALAGWCQGFLAALGEHAPEIAAPRPEVKPEPGSSDAAGADLTEILTDFAEISRAGLSDDDAADRDQADFALAELKEYARISTQIMFDELRPQRDERARVH